MGFFSSSDDSQPVTLPALTQDRMKSLFEEKEWKYFVDSDGDLGGIWDNNVFYFMLRGDQQEILFIQGRINLTVPFERLEEVREFENAWNRDKIWPKAYHRVDDEGNIILFADHASDWEDGVTNDQLMQTINCALSTSMGLFEEFKSELGL